MSNSMIKKLSTNKAIKDHIFEKSEIPQEFISTGSLVLNILYSGRLFGGIPVGKMSQIAAPSSLGKSFVGMKVAKNALKKDDDWIVIYIDTEMAFDYNFSESIGIDSNRLLVIQNNRLEEIQKEVMAIYEEFTKEEREKVLLIIDSWGAMVTSKTVDDATSGKDVSDMTISKKKNTFAKLITGLGMTVFVVNHVYDNIMNQYDPLSIPGGRGLYFASSSIVLGTSKSRAKETASSTDVIGALVLSTTKKSRFCKELTKLRFLIKYDGGIDPYHGILEDLQEMGVVVKPKNGWYQRNFEMLGIEGEDKNWREREINENGKEFYTMIIKDEGVQKFFEEKYTFLHSEINDEDF